MFKDRALLTLITSALVTSIGVNANTQPSPNHVSSHSVQEHQNKTAQLSFRDIAQLNLGGSQPTTPSASQATASQAQNVFSTESLIAKLRGQYGQDFDFKADSKAVKAKVGELTHQRFSPYYQGYPVWGHQIAVHSNAQGEVVKLNGQVVKAIGQSLYLQGEQSAKYDQQHALDYTVKQLLSRHAREQGIAHTDITLEDQQVKAFVYLPPLEQSHQHIGSSSNNQQARLVYHVSFYHHLTNQIFAPNALVDANTLEIINIWDGIKHLDATGPGGNEKIGRYQYGQEKPALDVTQQGNVCRLENDSVKTVHLNWVTYSPQNDSAHRFVCSNNDVEPVNGAYSPLNDAHYHGTKAVQMFKQWFDADVVDEGKLTLKLHRNYSKSFFTQSAIYIGDGDDTMFPHVTINAIGHEIGHRFSYGKVDSYDYGQTGSVLESFSDITGETLEYFITGEVDWLVDADILKRNKPLRYFQNPSADGKSIEHTDNYRDELGAHEGAGIFNKAFYSLANTQGWDIRKAYSVFVDAKQYYWSGYNFFNQAACGVIHAADDRGLNAAQVDKVFVDVGVYCDNLPNTDIDGDGMADLWEIRYGFNPSSAADGLLDRDNDGLLNVDEFVALSSPVDPDSDGDYLSDYDEVKVYKSYVNYWDSNQNEVEDGLEVQAGLILNLYRRVYSELDGDGDGIGDIDEVLAQTDPLDFDSKPSALLFATESFEQSTLPNGWHIDVQNEQDKRHLWQFDNSDASAGQQSLTAQLAFKDGDTQLSWYGLFGQQGYVIFDYAYQGEDLRLMTKIGGFSLTPFELNQKQATWHRHSEEIAAGFSNVVWKAGSYSGQGSFSIDNVMFIAKGADQDGDGMDDHWEHLHYLDFNDASDGSFDNDNDGLSNSEEAALGTNPNQSDSDGDGYSDYAEVNLYHTNPASKDNDNDGMEDVWEVRFGLDKNANDAEDDLDNDGYSNIDEFFNGTEPNNAQSYPEGVEFFQYDFENGVPDNFNLGSAGFGWSLEQQIDGSHSLRADDIDAYTIASMSFQRWFSQGQLILDLQALFGFDFYEQRNYVYIYVDDRLLKRVTYSRGKFKESIDIEQGWHTVKVKFYRHYLSQPARDEVRIDNITFFAENRDSDNDGLLDYVEYLRGLDYTDSTDAAADPDNDGLTNAQEYQYSTQLNNPDSDFDGLSDGDEALVHRTNPVSADSDWDWMGDKWEVDNNLNPFSNDKDQDPDDDSYSNWEEYQADTDPNDAASFPNTAVANYYSFTDGQLPSEFRVDESEIGQWQVHSDGTERYLKAVATVGQTASISLNAKLDSDYVMFDYQANMSNGSNLDLEYFNRVKAKAIYESTDGWKRVLVRLTEGNNSLRWTYSNGNTVDGDVLIDNILVTGSGEEYDFDQDGLPDLWEFENGLDSFDASDSQQDLDNDGLTNYQEYQAGTYVDYADSDGDGLTDGDEVNIHNTNPRTSDSDSDGLYDIDEIALGFDPNENNRYADSDNDGFTDEQEYYYGTDHNNGNDKPEVFDFYQHTFEDDRLLPPLFNSYASNSWFVTAEPGNSSNKVITHQIDDSQYRMVLSWRSFFARGSVFVDAKLSDNSVLIVYSNLWGTSESRGESQEWQRHEINLPYNESDLSTIEFVTSNYRSLYNTETWVWLDNITYIADGRDFDNDSIADNWEYRYRLNFNDANDALLDSDNDGLTNAQEYQFGGHPYVADTDGDGLNDYQEAIEYQTSLTHEDSDEDGFTDAWEVANGLDPNQSNEYVDTDGDGYTDVIEDKIGTDLLDAQSQPSTINYVMYDFEDGQMPRAFSHKEYSQPSWQVKQQLGYQQSTGLIFTDFDVETDDRYIELTWTGYFAAGQLSFDWKSYLKDYSFGFKLISNGSTQAYASDDWESLTFDIEGGFHQFSWVAKNGSQLDHVRAFVDNIRFVATDYDNDNDGMDDQWEVANGLNPTDSTDSSADTDGDGLTNLEEYQALTNVNRVDSDGDMISDYDEINTHSTSPINLDSDNDGLFDHLELHYGLDANNAQTSNDIDDDGVNNVAETLLFTSPVDSESNATSIAIASQNFANSDALIHWQSHTNKGAGWQVQTEQEAKYLSTELSDQYDNASALWLGQFPSGKLYFNYWLAAELTDNLTLSYNEQTLMVKKGSNDWLSAKVKLSGAEQASAITWTFTKTSDSSNQAGAKIDNILFIADGTDQDADGMSDQWEYENGLNFADANDAGIDLDNDGLTNLQEYQAGTNINNADTDNDGYTDGYEIENGLDPHDNSDGIKDSDGDGLSDQEEEELGTDPNNPDTDGDGVNDGVDAFPLDARESKDEDGNGIGDNYQVDYDYDGMPNTFELEYGLDAYSDDTALDLDNDGMTNWQEYVHQFEPNNPADASEDADNDSFSNLAEIQAGSDPRNSASYPSNFGSWIWMLLRDG